MKNVITVFVFVTTAAVSLLIISTCSDEERPGPIPMLTFSGFVTDSVTELAIDSAMVSLNDTSDIVCYSYSAGHFHGLTYIGRPRMFVQRENYETRWQDVDLMEDGQGLVFELPPLNR